MPYPITPFARARVREYAEIHMDGLVTIVRGKRGGLDPTTGRVRGMAVDVVVYGSTAPDGPVVPDPEPPPDPFARVASMRVVNFGDEPQVSVAAADFTTPGEQAGSDTGAKARIHTVTGQGSISNGAGDIDVRQVQVSIPWAISDIRRDDIVLVRDGGQDAGLKGSVLRVVEVEGGGAFGDARRLSCTLWGRSEYWSGSGSTP